MGGAPGIGERLLALELAVAALQAELRTLMGTGTPPPATRAHLQEVPTEGRRPPGGVTEKG
jgi:hypothetical protein